MEFDNLICDLDIRDASSTLTCEVQQPVQIQEEYLTKDEFTNIIVFGSIGIFFIALFTMIVWATTGQPTRRKGYVTR